MEKINFILYLSQWVSYVPYLKIFDYAENNFPGQTLYLIFAKERKFYNFHITISFQVLLINSVALSLRVWGKIGSLG